MKVVDMKVNHVENMMGYDVSHLSLSWKMVDNGRSKKQKYAQIRVWEKDRICFDSGKDENASSTGYCISMELKPRTRYDWEVIITDENGEQASGKSWFETGKMYEEWIGKWIASTMSPDTFPVFVTSFETESIPAKARMYLCALGVYEVYINNVKVGDEFLSPGYHSYDLHLQAQTYDVTDYIKKGSNTVKIMTGDGWFKGRIGFQGGYTDVYGDRCCVISELYLTDIDGDPQVIVTDENWKSYPSPVVSAGIYDGEVYDARLEEPDVYYPVKESIPESCGKLEDRWSLPIREMETLPVKELIYTPKDEWVLDFGQNLTGWVEFLCDLPAGETICLTAGEILQNECFYRENYRTAKAEFKYISNGEKRRVRPHFTFYGFRYMKVECGGKIIPENFTAVHLRSSFKQIGQITTGNKKVNQLFSNIIWGQKDNFLDVPTDCPQRDEKLGWTGDAQIFSGTACYNMDVAAFFRKYLWDMRAEQSLMDGSVPNVVPCLKHGLVAQSGACPWADAAVIIPWNVYLHYGDKGLLKEMYPGMKAWVEYQRIQEEKQGGDHLIKDGFHFGDWLALDNPGPEPFGKTDSLYIASVYYYKCTEILAKASELLERDVDHLFYKKLAEEIKTAINHKYFDENGSCLCQTQTGDAIAVMFNLVPDKVLQEGQALDEKVAENHGHLDTGFVGTTFLCPALTITGHHKRAVDLLLNEAYPGWLYCVNLGATTIWERWNSVLEDGTMNPEGMNSLNHYSYGSVGEWMYAYLGGLQPVSDAPGFKRAIWQPYPDERLKYFDMKLDSASGIYQCSWKYMDDKTISYFIDIPFDCSVDVRLPEGNYRINGQMVSGSEWRLDAGKYEIIAEINVK